MPIVSVAKVAIGRSVLMGFAGFILIGSYDNENWTFFDNNQRSATLYTFSNSTTFTEDEVYIAYAQPYSYGRSVAHTAQILATPWAEPTISGDTNGVIGRTPIAVDDLGRLNPKRDIYAYPMLNAGGRFAGNSRATVENPNQDPNGLWHPSLWSSHQDICASGEAMQADVVSTPGAVDAFIDFHSTIPSSVGDDFGFIEISEGDVDQADLTAWHPFGITNATDHHQGDADGDQDVDGKDFLTWQRQFTDNLSTLSVSISVPEPSTGILIIGLLSMISGSRIRRRREWAPYAGAIPQHVPRAFRRCHQSG